METSERKKLCWNCEGDVNYDAIFCPFCGSDLKRPKPLSQLMPEDEHYKSLNDSLASLYKPPYIAREEHGYGVPDEREEDFYEDDDVDDPIASRGLASVDEEEETEGRFVWALILLSFGGNLLTLGLLIFFFSDKGSLVLEWKRQYWFLYALLSSPFLFMGWKCFSSRAES
ncbi:MAG: zinc ribbon domain-containing protein [Simkaniaceae bacterium]